MSDQTISNLGEPLEAKDAVNLGYLAKSLTAVIQDRDYYSVPVTLG